MLPDGVALRPRTGADEPFLFELYASTREEELRATGWSDGQKRAFLEQQFRAQTLHYDNHYPSAERAIVERAGKAVGRIYLHRGEREIRIVDIALLPEARGAGIGTALLKMVLAEAAGAGQSVTIHVEQFNPALRLYRRLGFEPVELRGAHLLLQRDQAKIA